MPIQSSDKILFKGESGITEIAPTSLLIFVDDTGHEGLNNPDVPFFGFGGCVIPASQYLRNVHTPWMEVEKHFPAEMLPLHAADLRPHTMRSEIGHLSTFFENGQFGRFGGVITDEAINETQQNIYHIMATQTYNRVEKIASNFAVKIDRVDMIFEHSTRTEEMISDYFSRTDPSINGKKFPVKRWFMRKSKEMPSGLVVADFIAHTAGVSVRTRLRAQSETYGRRDFEAVFKPANEKLVSFMEIVKIEIN